MLDTLPSVEDPAKVLFRRDHQQREAGFVMPRGRERVDACESKGSALNPDLKNLRTFRAACPQGCNHVVVPQAQAPTPLRVDGLLVELVTPAHLKTGE